MTGFNHGMTGAAIALVVKQPALAITLSFISHFAIDMIPHFGFPEKDLFRRKFNVLLIADFIFAICLMIILAILFPSQKWLIWTCMIAAAIPDAASAYYRLYIERIKKTTVRQDPLYVLHRKIQWSQTIPGAYVEALWFIGIISFILIEHYSSVVATK
jgi:hypothetical protein